MTEVMACYPTLKLKIFLILLRLFIRLSYLRCDGFRVSDNACVMEVPERGEKVHDLLVLEAREEVVDQVLRRQRPHADNPKELLVGEGALHHEGDGQDSVPVPQLQRTVQQILLRLQASALLQAVGFTYNQDCCFEARCNSMK